MLRASAVIPAADSSDGPDDVIELDFDARHRRRIVMTSAGGIGFLLDLPHAVALADGDGLRLDDGRIIRVRAKSEPLLEIGAASRPALTRIAWHLGNRHLPTQIVGDSLRIRSDHVIAAMIRQLGGTVKELVAPFQPEGGAYEGAGHDH
jgi:urease accessory protein